MRFKCEECSTSYKIADEKVRGKVLKIRCRRCKAIIVVRGEPAAGARGRRPKRRADGSRQAAAVLPQDNPEATRMMPVSELREQLKAVRGAGADEGYDEERTAMMPLPELERVRRAAREDTAPEPSGLPEDAAGAAPPEVEWHAVIRGKQVGPIGEAELAARARSGEVTRATYVWCDGMDQWLPIRDVPALRHLFADEVAEKGEARANGASEGPLLPFEDADEAPSEDAPAPPTAGPEPSPASLASLFDDVSVSDEAPGEKPDPFAEATGAPSDPFAAVAARDDLEPPPPRETTQMYIMASGVEKQKSPLRIALFALGFVVFLGGFGYLLSATGSVDFGGLMAGGPKKDTPRSGTTWNRDPSRAEEVRKKLLGLDRAEETPPKGGAAGPAPGRGAMRPSDEDGPLKAKEALPVEELDEAQAAQLAELYQTMAGKKVKFQIASEKPSVKGVDSAKSPIEPKIIAEKFQASMPAYQDCVMRELRRNPSFAGGRVVLTVTIAPSGIVTGARLDDRLLDRSDVGVCIKRAAKRMVFPSFGSEEPIEVEAPLILSAAL